MEKLIKLVEKSYIRPENSEMNIQVGDTVKAHIKVVEGEKSRVQIFEGIVISIRGEGLSKTIKIRKISYAGVGVEKTFLLNSPVLDKLDVIKQGQPKRAKLYYLRDRVGKKAVKVRERSSDHKLAQNLNPSKKQKNAASEKTSEKSKNESTASEPAPVSAAQEKESVE